MSIFKPASQHENDGVVVRVDGIPVYINEALECVEELIKLLGGKLYRDGSGEVCCSECGGRVDVGHEDSCELKGSWSAVKNAGLAGYVEQPDDGMHPSTLGQAHPAHGFSNYVKSLFDVASEMCDRAVFDVYHGQPIIYMNSSSCSYYICKIDIDVEKNHVDFFPSDGYASFGKKLVERVKAMSPPYVSLRTY